MHWTSDWRPHWQAGLHLYHCMIGPVKVSSNWSLPMRHDPKHRLPELLAGNLSIVTTLRHFRFKPIVVLWNQLICQLTNVPVEILALKRDNGCLEEIQGYYLSSLICVLCQELIYEWRNFIGFLPFRLLWWSSNVNKGSDSRHSWALEHQLWANQPPR